MPVVLVTQEAEAGELVEPRSCHCSRAWATEQDSISKKEKVSKKMIPFKENVISKM